MAIYNGNKTNNRTAIICSSLFFISACVNLPPYDDSVPAQFSETSQKSLAEINRCNTSWLNRALSGNMLLIKDGYVYRHEDTNTVLKLTDDGSVRTLRGYYRTGFSIRVFDTRDQFIASAKACMK